MQALALSGWGQRADALAAVTPENTIHFDYAAYDGVERCFDALAQQQAEVVVGWSLGGQIAVRAIAKGILKPQRLILLAVPYQCCASEDFPQASAPEALAESREAFITDGNVMFKQFQGLIAKGHADELPLIRHLRGNLPNASEGNWLYWFDELIDFSCNVLSFDGFPPTYLLYGDGDKIVPPAQAGMFAKRLPQAESHLLRHCGHAPHWHSPERIKRLVSI